MSKPIALGYSRVSTKEQVERGSSIPFQKEKVKEKAKELGYILKQQYSDDGISGGSTARKDCNDMLASLDGENVQAVIFYELSRTTRDLYDLLYLKKILEEKGIRLVSVAENLNLDTDEGDFMFKMQGLVNERQRKDTIKRVRAKMMDKHKKGEWCGGQVPYGFNIEGNKSSAHLVINEFEADIIRQIYNRFERRPFFRGIVRWLNENGIKTKRGETFAQSTVKRLLTNPIYKGIQTYGKRPASKGYAPKEKWLYEKANVKSIISEEQFDRVQNIVKNRPRIEKKRKHNVIYILDGGLMRCECGATLNGYTQPKPNGKLYFYYKCHNYMSKGSSVCKRPALVKSEIEQKVLQGISEKVKLQFEESEAREIGENSPVEELSRIEKHIQGLNARKQRLLDLYEDGSIEKDMLIKRMGKATLEIEQADDNKRRVEQEMDPKNKANRKTLMEKVNAGWDAMTDSEKKRVLKQLVKSLVVYYNGEVELELYEVTYE